MFKSIDGARTWTAFNMGLTNLSVSALTIDPQTPTRLYAGTARVTAWWLSAPALILAWARQLPKG